MNLSLRFARFARALLTGALIACAAVGAAPASVNDLGPQSYFAGGSPTTGAAAADAVTALLDDYYVGSGLWRDCPETRCWVHNSDWGSDALTNTLYLRWKTANDAAVVPILAALSASERRYAPPCHGERCTTWSDVPMWDAVSALREHEALPNDSVALQKAVAAFWAVEGSPVYGLGACPTIRYQRPFGRGDRLKTLETDSNGIKAALLLYEATREPQYLTIARDRYHAVRRYFLDARTPLYSVYVFDDGSRCVQAPHRYFASVNGNMIWNGLQLARDTGDERYREQAVATARAVEDDLSDPNGVFSDLQAENDIEEPLIEAMLELATSEHRTFARRWLLTNAAAAYSSRRNDGSYGRFFDGPPPLASTTAWQTSGGFAAQIAAAALAPQVAENRSAWSNAVFVDDEIDRAPFSIRFHGSGVALIGTLGEVCCQFGHARIFVDGVETTSGVGVWQNKSSSGQAFPNSVLFAWRWRKPGFHELAVVPGAYNAKEGDSYIHVRGYLVAGTSTASPRASKLK
jgi:hypothetical protein